MDLKEILSRTKGALSSQGGRLSKIENQIKVVKGRMGFYRGAAIVGWALASLLALILLVALRRERGFDQRQ